MSLSFSLEIYYSPTLFKTMGLDYSMQLVMSGVLNATQVCGRFPSYLGSENSAI